MSALAHQVFVTGQIPQSGRGPLPDGSPRMWSPISSTLITGSADAVLVDPPLTLTQAAEVGDWIEASGRRLTGIYLTHGHGDHWFGAIPLLQRFGDAVVYATAGTRQHMAAQNSPEFRAGFWDKVFPGSCRPEMSTSASSTKPGSDSRVSDCCRSRSVTPTPMPPPCCTCRAPDFLSPAMWSTTVFTFT